MQLIDYVPSFVDQARQGMVILHIIHAYPSQVELTI